MKLAVISDIMYRACTPDYENNLSFYGSEPYHALIAEGLSKNKKHDLHFFAPAGSEPIGTFHPLQCFNGEIYPRNTLDYVSLEGLTSDYLVDFDFILDFSAQVQDIEEIRNYHGYTNYGVFRNGYMGYDVPRLRRNDRHYIVPSYSNQTLFINNGFPDTTVCYYPVPDDFYFSGQDQEYISILEGLEPKSYYLFPHRLTKEKGTYSVLNLAKQFPQETFVFMVSNTPLMEHKLGIGYLKRDTKLMNLENVKFIQLPLTPKHHYFKRELMRNAKAVLACFDPSKYIEGFGLTNAEAVAMGVPLLISDSPSSRELWIDEKDGLIIPFDSSLWGFKQTIRNFSTYSFKPENRYGTENSINQYEDFISKRMSNDNR